MPLPRAAVVIKELGETPLQALERYRAAAAIDPSIPITYAGRLDPMASGRLLLLIGDECKKRSRYDALDKEYMCEILLGISSDSGDVLGLAALDRDYGAVSEAEIAATLEQLLGTQQLAYPAYSSKPVRGMPLFEHALKGTLGAIEIPKKEVRLYQLEYCGTSMQSGMLLLRTLEEKINALQAPHDPNKLGSDFRKEEILKRWRELLSESHRTFSSIRVRAVVSSGTYVRSLAELIASRLNTTGLVLSLSRTKIGSYQPLGRSRGFWKSTY